MQKKILRVILMIQIIILASIGSVANASSFKFIAEAEKEIIKIGETAVVQLSIDEINAGQEGINVVEMWFEYDGNVFEKVEFVEENNWRIEYNEQTGKILFVKMVAGVTEKENIGKIKLKSKNNLQDLDTEVKLKEITSNDGHELIDEGNRIIKFRIEEEKVVEPTPTQNPTQQPTNTPTSTQKPTQQPTHQPTQQPTNTPTSTQKPTSTPIPTKKPVSNIVENIKTGDIKPIIAISIVLIVIIANIIYFIIRKKSKKDEKK